MARTKDWNLVVQEANDNFTTLIDAADSSTTYIGKAKLGTATTESRWQVKKISVNGSVTTIAFAGGDDAFNDVWDDRASLSYN